MVLNRNPVNYFAEVEQVAYDPSNMPPGIEPSPDKMLQVTQRPAAFLTSRSFLIACFCASDWNRSVKMLSLVPQGRLFSYPDTHRHRLGANYLHIPVNCPYRARVANYQRDGPMCMSDNQGKRV